MARTARRQLEGRYLLFGEYISHSHIIIAEKCLTHEGASNQPTYATDINIIKEIKGEVM